MKWQTKSAVLRALDKLPAGDALYYFMQRNVTHSLPRPIKRIPEYSRNFYRHIEAFRSWGIDLDKGLLMTFGAGWDLFENLIFYGYGVNRQIVIDIKPLARRELINGIAAYLDKNAVEGAVPRRFLPLEEATGLNASLLRRYGIDYRTPGDARSVDLLDRAVDMIATTHTLEHIPGDVIADIMKECRRLISPGGAVSMLIDYSDHYSHADPSISVYNFLRFPINEWRPHNVDRHFQNRLRHSDYERLFEAAGFRIVTNEPERPSDWKRLLQRQPIAQEFRGYELEDLAVVRGYFLLVPVGEPAS
jgi:hypothetical protein